MTNHGPLPQFFRVEARLLGFRAYGRGIQQDFGAHQDHGSGTLREPLIPTDPNSDRSVARFPNLEAGVTLPKIEFLLIARTIGNVALAINAQQRSIRVDDRDAVVVGLPRALEERDGKNDLELRRQLLEMSDGGMPLDGPRSLKVSRFLFSAEVVAFKQLRGQEDLRAPGRRLAD